MADVAPSQPEPWVPVDSFGTRLVLIRRELDLTTEEAAAKCGLKAATWNTWENGARPRGMDSVVASIAKGLGVNRAWLMWGHETLKTRSERSRTAGQRYLTSLDGGGKRPKNLGSPLLSTVT